MRKLRVLNIHRKNTCQKPSGCHFRLVLDAGWLFPPPNFCFRSKVTNSGPFSVLKSFGFQLCTFSTLEILNNATQYSSCCVLLFPVPYKVSFLQENIRLGEEKRLYFYIPLDSLLPFKTLIVRKVPLPVFQVLASVFKSFLFVTTVSFWSSVLAPDRCPTGTHSLLLFYAIKSASLATSIPPF